MGSRWNRLYEPVFVPAQLFRMTGLGDYEKFYAPCTLNAAIVCILIPARREGVKTQKINMPGHAAFISEEIQLNHHKYQWVEKQVDFLSC